MKSKLALAAYLATVFTLTLIHDWRLLACAFAVICLLAWRDVFYVTLRAVAASAVFTGFVSISYAAVSLWQGRDFADYLLMLNFRVLDLTMLAFLLIRRVNLFDALSFSKTLSLMLTLTVSRIESYKKLFFTFKEALAARSFNRNERFSKETIATVSALFLNRSIVDAKENLDALKARGFHV